MAMIQTKQDDRSYEERKKATNTQNGSKYIPQVSGTRPRLNMHGEVVSNNRKDRNSRGVQSRMELVQHAPVQVILNGKARDGTQVEIKVKTRSMKKIQHVRVPILATVKPADDGQ